MPPRIFLPRKMNHDTSSVLSLISKIHSQSQDFLQKKMRASGLPEMVSSHGFILYKLSQTERMTLGELTAEINRDKSTTTALVKKLEELGLVQTRRCPLDSRKKYTSLTENGKEYTETTQNLSKELLETAYKGFSEDEKETLLQLLEKLSGNL